LEALRSDFEFEEKTKTALDDFSTDWESVLDSVETAKSILGRDRVRYNLQGFLDGTDKASFVAGLSQDQLEYAENLKSKWLSAQNKAYKTLKTMYKKDSSLFPAISSEEDIDKMSADVALEHLKSARVINNEQRSITLATVNLGTMLEDVTQNSRKLEREVGDKEKELTEAKAQIAVSLYDGSADSDLIDAANKGSK